MRQRPVEKKRAHVKLVNHRFVCRRCAIALHIPDRIGCGYDAVPIGLSEFPRVRVVFPQFRSAVAVDDDELVLVAGLRRVFISGPIAVVLAEKRRGYPAPLIELSRHAHPPRIGCPDAKSHAAVEGGGAHIRALSKPA